MKEEALTPVFRVADTEAAVGWYQRLGFVLDYEHSSGPAFSRTMVLVRRGELALILSNRDEDARSDGLIYLRVVDTAAIADEFSVELKESPVASHIELQDPDGNRLRIATSKLARPAREKQER